MGPQNAIFGDDDLTALPQTELQEQDYEAEKRMVRFSKTKEFKVLREYIDARIDFYQTYLPDGRPINSVTTVERGQQWVIANAVIGELKMIIDSYEQANETVKNAR